MSAVGTLISAMVDGFIPDGTLARMRLRATLDMLTTLVVTVLAVALTIGYQVFGRWARRKTRAD